MICTKYVWSSFSKSFLLIYLFSCFVSCDEKDKSFPDPENENSATDESLVLEIDRESKFQIIDNFGASDAWSGQFVGNWPLEKKQKISDLLFSQELNSEGSPKGIGLSLWRFNLGAGSAEQGDQSGIDDVWRRAPSFLQPDGTHNWSKLQSQIWIAEAAEKHGVEQFLLFSNSPPVFITRNGKAFTSDPAHSNLAMEKYDEFATYLVDAIEGLRDQGLEVDYISPVNEPQWDWADGGQEGTPFWNNEIAGIVRALNNELVKRDVSASIDIPEAGQINYLYEEGNRPGRSNQIYSFFNENSENYIGDLSHAGHVVSGHSYFTTSPFSRLISQRRALANTVDNYQGLKYWMTEYCILGDNSGEINGSGRNLGIDPALYVARVIHSDLAVANASAWHWWLAISPYDYKDGLVYIDKDEADGKFYESKILWALGNYSRFIRPGYRRIAIEGGGEAPDKEFLFSAYEDPQGDEVVVVIVNSKKKDVPVRLNEKGKAVGDYVAYVTSGGKDLEKTELQTNGEGILIPSNSVTTIVINAEAL